MENIEQIKASLKRSATSMRTRITKFQTYLQKKQYDRDSLEVRKENIVDNYRIFKETFEDASAKIVDEEIQIQLLNEELIIEESYTEIIADTNRILRKLTEKTMSSNSLTPETNIPQITSPITSTSNIRLPEINLPMFDGSYENWPTFRDQFVTRIDKNSKLSEIDKFQYLQSSVTNRAAKLIDGMSMTHENYKEAWKLLQEKYEDSRRIVSRHWEILFNLTPLSKNTPQATGDLVDTVRQHIRALKNLGSLIDDSMIIYLICSKLNPNVVYNWELTLEDNTIPSYESLLNFLGKRSSCTLSYPQQGIISQKSNATTHKKQAFQVNVGNATYKMECHVCKDDVLPTAVVFATSYNKQQIIGRALLDSGSTANFMTKNFAESLKLPKKPCSIPISTINEISTIVTHTVDVEITSRYKPIKRMLRFLIVPCISSSTPQAHINREGILIPKNIQLADPDFHIPASIDMLIGVGTFLSMLSVGQIHLPNTNDQQLIVQKTLLGWIIGGSISSSINMKRCYHADLISNLNKFWEIEDLPTVTTHSAQDNDCEDHYIKNVQRTADGRYIVSLPFNSKRETLGRSKQMALKRLVSLEKRFKHQPDVEKLYRQVINEYKELGHMQLIQEDDDNGFYLPHHAVFKHSSSTTKLRVVFDGSAKTSTGISLNQTLFNGPTIQPDLFTQLLKFRLHNYVITGDIEKMYRQIYIRPEDRKYQKILWREESGELSVYQLNTVTFGLTPAPFLAIRTIHQLVDDEGSNYPLAIEPLKYDLYVDDLLSGSDTVDKTIQIRDQVIALLNRGGFNLRQCASNDKRILGALPDTKINLNLLHEEEHNLKTLGIYWNPNNDTIEYTVRPPPIHAHLTKRIIASEIAKIFDPLGLVNPSIVQAKLIMQTLWQSKIDWDESLPIELQTRWSKFSSQLPLLNKVIFNRKIKYQDAKRIELHGFCDASLIAYGACIYIRSENEKGETQVQLYCSKSRLAPLNKPQTIPRYELCAALLLVQLYQLVQSSIAISFDKVHFWSDSTIVIHWIHTSPHLLKPFIANRIAKIQEISKATDWRHVRTHDNPADLLSRGEDPERLYKSTLWRQGPKWLTANETNWPYTPLVLPEEIPELRKVTCLKIEKFDDSLFYKFSSFTKLQRVIAYCFRFKNRGKVTGPLTIEELEFAHNKIIFLTQRIMFTNEIAALKKEETCGLQTRIRCLNPFIDDSGLIRVGGRLKNAGLPFNTQHPILLPKSYIISTLLVRQFHETNLHAGIQATLAYMRQYYWLIDGKNQVKFILHKCITCIRCKPPTVEYKMADLPSPRVNIARPFLNTGVDYAGPIFIKEKKHRNRTQVKSYLAIFVCMATKAIHIELVSDLTSEGFIGALRRFTSRRGKCANIYSDNGKNFVGAHSELKRILDTLQAEVKDQSILRWLQYTRIKWHFNPPYSPHSGGIWEAAVKSVKHHLNRVMGKELFTFEQLTTLLVEIEAILNSRPLTPLSSDPNDLQALTPSHFLIGDSMINLPDHNYVHVQSNKLSLWQNLQKFKRLFWDRWQREYLNELNIRSKWSTGQHPIHINTMVIIREDNQPPLYWKLGRVIEVCPGRDGIVRVVKIRTQGGVVTRNVKYLAPLPIETDNSVVGPVKDCSTSSQPGENV